MSEVRCMIEVEVVRVRMRMTEGLQEMSCGCDKQ
jgi:hypothetical protein